MENLSLNEKINELVVKMAKEPNNIENYHALSELYLQQQDYDKVMSVLDSLLAMFKLLSVWVQCGFMKEISENLCLIITRL